MDAHQLLTTRIPSTERDTMEASLIDIAESINSARIIANANELTAPQRGVYGDLSEALGRVLRLMTGDNDRAKQMYQNILDGATVRQAYRATEPARPRN
jgi:ABC-type transporter Mla subunit MlaD